jgi:hypothetical protein
MRKGLEGLGQPLAEHSVHGSDIDTHEAVEHTTSNHDLLSEP